MKTNIINTVETKLPLESKNYWYFFFVVIGAIVTAILADENFKALIGSYFVFFVIADKMISAYLRTITSKKIVWKKPSTKLNPMDEALRQDDIDIKDI